MKQVVVVLLIFMSLALCACAGPSQTVGSETSFEPVIIADDAAGDVQSDEAPDATSTPTINRGGENMVIGRVESVAGNEVVLELGEISGDPQRNGMPGMPDGEMPPRPSGDVSGAPQRNGPQGGGAMGAFPPDSGGPRRTFSPDMTPDPDMRGGNRGQGADGDMPFRNLDITYTGEKATYMLPADLKIGSGDYTAIKAGMVLRLALDENKAVTAVSILSQ